jgi:hypothetical protein
MAEIDDKKMCKQPGVAPGGLDRYVCSREDFIRAGADMASRKTPIAYGNLPPRDQINDLNMRIALSDAELVQKSAEAQGTHGTLDTVPMTRLDSASQKEAAGYLQWVSVENMRLRRQRAEVRSFLPKEPEQASEKK